MTCLLLATFTLTTAVAVGAVVGGLVWRTYRAQQPTCRTEVMLSGPQRRLVNHQRRPHHMPTGGDR